LTHPAQTERLPWRILALFATASLITIALGAVAMAQDGIGPGLWLRNPIAWLVGGALAVFLARRGWLIAWMAPAALIVIGLSFIGPEQEGVHRWLGLGPIHLNAAALVLPAAIAAFSRERTLLATACFILIAGLLAWQPDISQLAGFAIASFVLAAHRFGWRGAIISLVLAAAMIPVCLSRPDPLDPVPHVEGIFFMDQSPILSIAMAASLTATALSPLVLWPVGGLRWKAVALTGYFAATALACLFGAYPAPLAGYGLSFVVGWWLGLASLSLPPKPVTSLS
jgi:hypothetical protein